MTATTEDLRLPVPLREYLEAGCDPATVDLPAFHHFQDEIVNVMDEGVDTERRAYTARWEATEILEDRDPSPGMWTDKDSRDVIVSNWGSLQRYLTWCSWAADLFEDPGLADLLRGFMSPDELARLDWLIAATKAPHPLVVGRPEYRSCEGCGEDCSELALSIGCVEGYSDSPDVTGWCFGCVTRAYEAMKAAQS